MANAPTTPQKPAAPVAPVQTPQAQVAAAPQQNQPSAIASTLAVAAQPNNLDENGKLLEGQDPAPMKPVVEPPSTIMQQSAGFASGPTQGEAAISRFEAQVAARSSSEPIESVVIKTFYDEENRLVEEGQRYAYYPKKDQPYPWTVMQPVDASKRKELKAEFDAFKADKRDESSKKAEARDALTTALRGV